MLKGNWGRGLSRMGAVVVAVGGIAVAPIGAHAASGTFGCAVLQAALDASNDGDVITLNELCVNMAFTMRTGKSITLTGTAGAGFNGPPDNTMRMLIGTDVKTSTISNLLFENGTFNAGGGSALSLDGDTSVRLLGNVFKSNAGSGEAIQIFDNTHAGPHIVVDSNTFGGPGLSDGNTSTGRGAFNIDSNNDVDFTNNLVQNNTGVWAGGGYIEASGRTPNAVLVRGNRFIANRSQQLESTPGIGGGLHTLADGSGGSTWTIDSNTFQFNRASSSGGGLEADLGSEGSNPLTLTRNSFLGNTVQCDTPNSDCGLSQGGGAHIGTRSAQTVTQSQNVFDSNHLIATASTLAYSGGGESITDLNPSTSLRDVFTRNVVDGTAGSDCAGNVRYGGGLSVLNMQLTGKDMAVAGNSIGNCGRGGGIYLGYVASTSAELDLFDATISGNSVGKAGIGPGAAGQTANEETLNLTNSVVAGNHGDTPDTMMFSTVTARSSDICTGQGLTGGAMTGTGNVCVDPALANPDGGDVHETASSPTKDIGANSLIPTGLAVDYEGDPRIANGVVDMGADEFEVAAAVLPTLPKAGHPVAPQVSNTGPIGALAIGILLAALAAAAFQSRLRRPATRS